MADSAPKPSSSVKLVLLGEAAVGKVHFLDPKLPPRRLINIRDSHHWFCDSSTMIFRKTRSPLLVVCLADVAVTHAMPQEKRLLICFPAAFLTQKCNLPTRTIKFEIWDTAGQERFASLAPMYYRNAQAALVVYDLTKPTSLVKAKHWVAELQRQASPGIVIALVGNKLDLTGDSTGSTGDEGEDGEDSGDARKISTEEAQSYAEEESLLFFETSAKSGHNVTEVFTAIANAIPETSLKSARGTGAASAANRGNDEQRVNLGNTKDAGAKDSCAC